MNFFINSLLLVSFFPVNHVAQVHQDVAFSCWLDVLVETGNDTRCGLLSIFLFSIKLKMTQRTKKEEMQIVTNTILKGKKMSG